MNVTSGNPAESIHDTILPIPWQYAGCLLSKSHDQKTHVLLGHEGRLRFPDARPMALPLLDFENHGHLGFDGEITNFDRGTSLPLEGLP